MYDYGRELTYRHHIWQKQQKRKNNNGRFLINDKKNLWSFQKFRIVSKS